VIEGAILPASFARRGRKHQYVFLNGRPVEDQTISRALREGFKGALPEGLQPGAWLWITMDPALVDVNVHPAKREVRFADPAQIRIAIMDAIEAALRPPSVTEAIVIESATQKNAVRLELIGGSQQVVRERASAEGAEGEPNESHQDEGRAGGGVTWRHEEQKELGVEEVSGRKGDASHVPHAPDFRIVGALSDRYALLEGEEGLVLLEPRAARERIFYEQLLAGGERIDSQGLLVPVLVELDVREIDLLMRHREHFDQAGFTLESFGGQTVTISAAPAFLNSKNVKKALLELVDLVIDRDGLSKVKRLAYEGFSAKVSQVAARQVTWNEAALPALLADLFHCDLPYCDPSGKPTLVQISYQDLDRKFGKN